MSGMGIAYNTSLALFGGTAPIIATAVVESKNIVTYGFVLFGFGMVSFITDFIVGLYVLPLNKIEANEMKKQELFVYEAMKDESNIDNDIHGL